MDWGKEKNDIFISKYIFISGLKSKKARLPSCWQTMQHGGLTEREKVELSLDSKA
jgi:hypothetical protein